uniref:Guanylate cyclase domain-containing protein n=1 Tax=Melopsittacus undulatus TaxID=13146 RepID=A0A8V5H5H7_MELUD
MLTLGGDVLKFAGDSVLLLWRARHNEMARTISLVVHCSLQIQKKYRRRNVLTGPKFQLKIGISAGSMHYLRFEGERQKYFCVVGKAVDDVCEAEKLAKAGEIVLSASCWEHCEKHRLRTSHIAGEAAVKVDILTYIPKAALEKVRLGHCCWGCFFSQDRSGAFRNGVSVRASKTKKMHPEMTMWANWAKGHRCHALAFQLEDRVPQDFLSELRPVTILFLHLNFDTKSIGSFHSVLNEVSSVMEEIIYPHKGEVNKVFLFDKGCTFLCVFGLPGAKLPNESIHALQSALQIFNSCSEITANTGKRQCLWLLPVGWRSVASLATL